ncbi:putative 2-oxoglutarate dehydrogenase E1 component DHKTD1, mitochondrial [Hypsibius exemplaris]|uniref:2-oxoglutarate dehydrogenase E1 component DHKTD1, mitochondrial n=1 Tax=Hypsibius exemplaris TaxID=2072580 RepID=A0A1W0WMK3_HYPEX|nr:putative 2-oxoglutarate dehydrogenase E1 component DHKTD1, mitochondrial [Hypsibius exemplaris]
MHGQRNLGCAPEGVHSAQCTDNEPGMRTARRAQCAMHGQRTWDAHRKACTVRNARTTNLGCAPEDVHSAQCTDIETWDAHRKACTVRNARTTNLGSHRKACTVRNAHQLILIFFCFFITKKNLELFPYALPPELRFKMFRALVSGSRRRNPHAAARYMQARNLSFAQNKNWDGVGVQQPQPWTKAGRLVEAYRTHGHKFAQIDPLSQWTPAEHAPELSPLRHGFTSDSEPVESNGIFGLPAETTVVELQAALRKIYSGRISVEFQHLFELEEREWFAQRFEQLSRENFPAGTKKRMAELLIQTQVFDNFLGSKYPTLKRYGGEGAEGNLIFMDQILTLAAELDYHTAVVCMPHRGRLNVLAINLGLDPSYMFRKINGKSEFPDDVKSTGDVLSHLSASADLKMGDKKRQIHVTMLPNPSQLEANNPVAVGKARGRQQTLKSGDYAEDTTAGDGKKVLCIQIHGDASFAGQGIVAETFTFASLPHYSVGGSVHFITNNQIGFTTPSNVGRSSVYSSDISKINACPVIHVNGDSPEDVLRATTLALEYKDEFGKDVVIDMLCCRLHGHNEVDDPTLTQPVMYDAIRRRPSLPDSYAKQLTEDGVLTADDVSRIAKEYDTTLRDAFNNIDKFKPKAFHLEREWSGLVQPSKSITVWDTGFPIDALKYVGAKSVEAPKDGSFETHRHLEKTHMKARFERIKEGTKLDWATGEALAVGSLLLQEFDVRISGQDVGRGTFSHRHAVLVDQVTNTRYVPLNHLIPDQEAKYEVANSVLSEEAVLGFDYGMSIESPKRLVIWEAQFGDFFTGAQIIIDTYVTSGETKWLVQSGLVMLLPHGYDGAGPEHSSCRIERFLQQTDSSEVSIDGDDVNFCFAVPTTPAQYFHLLRRQIVRNYRKPLIVASPKTVLRLPAAVSDLSEMAPGTHFQPVLPDAAATDSKKVTRVVFVSGKHYYTLDKHRDAEKIGDTAIVRVEELCPFPTEALRVELQKYPNAKKVIWSQEEPRNMGAWSFIQPRFQNLLGVNLTYIGRPQLPAVAVGIGAIHEQQNKDIVQGTFA